MKKFLLLAVPILLVAITACSDEQDYSPTKQSNLQSQNSKSKEVDPFFTSNSTIPEFNKLTTLLLPISPKTYIIAKLGKDPSTYDYGFGKLGDELDKQISEAINDGTISHVKEYKTDNESDFNDWVNQQLKDGRYLKTSFNAETGEWEGKSYDKDEYKKLNSK